MPEVPHRTSASDSLPGGVSLMWPTDAFTPQPRLSTMLLKFRILHIKVT